VQLESRLRDYHEKARGLQLVPRGAKWSSNVDFTLRLDESALDKVSLGLGGGVDLGSERRAASNALLGGADMKGVIKNNLRFLRTTLIKHQTMVRTSMASIAEEIERGCETKAQVLRGVGDAETAVASIEASARREAEAGDSKIAEASAAIAAARAVCDSKRQAADSAGSAAGELSPGVLADLEASISSMEVSQRAERQRLSDLVARCLLRVSEHKQSCRTRLDCAAAAVINTKQRVACVEAEREARISVGRQ